MANNIENCKFILEKLDFVIKRGKLAMAKICNVLFTKLKCVIH